MTTSTTNGMEQQRKFDPDLEDRLIRWAKWSIDINNNQVGYPPQSPLVDVIEVGIFSPNFGPRSPYMDEKAMQISWLVNQLAQGFPLYAQALRDYYFNLGVPKRYIAQARGINVRTLESRIQAGKIWLEGALLALDSYKNGEVCNVK